MGLESEILVTNTSSDQIPEQSARDLIDRHLIEAVWIAHNKKAIAFNSGQGNGV
jgi:hypothetical protein